jgi:UDP-N-acetylglucosamine acyltransferase
MTIHPSACVEEGAALGAGVTIGPFAYVAGDTSIGASTSIGPHAVIHRFTSLGRECRVHAGAVLGDLPQDLGFDGKDSRVRIGERCVIREGATVHRGTGEGTETVIGNDCMLMAFSHVGHNSVLAERVIMANGVLLGGHVHVGERTFFGGGAGVHQFVHIGRLCMIGGNCGITKDIPPFCMTRAVAYDRIAGLNVIGLRRAGMNAGERMGIQTIFKLFYASDLNVSQALEQSAAMRLSAPAQEFVDFIRSSKRGICGRQGNRSAQ